MAYCTQAEVRNIIATGLNDDSLTALITLADAEIESRGLDSALSAVVLKQLSMLITASLAAMNDVASYGKSDYQAGGTSLSRLYRERADDLIARSGDIPLTVHNDSLDNDYASDE